MEAFLPNILLIDPDRAMHTLLRRDLCGHGYSLMTASNTRQALALLRMEPNLALLELELPDTSGLELLSRLREKGEDLPIIAFSENGDIRTKIQALDLGACDFLQKPFDVEELAARIRVALRGRFAYRVEQPVYRLAQLEVDLRRRMVRLAEEEIHLSPKEYDLLRLFVVHAGKVLTHQFLMSELWEEKVDTQFLRVYVRQLRSKIEEDPTHPRYLLTQMGVGYRLCPPDAASNPH
ncbi:response regulator transcription factor [Bradyrhizobium sp. Ai1a-2]|uniref:response regulator transcription factor n=1 Tax=Bradyrhizobium sp. Ai1a-2 TaxID=196490 RepID=UPI00042467EB|nr:response regulator transcription factor [Bradyrhizobium sp. Ai1a-2]